MNVRLVTRAVAPAAVLVAALGLAGCSGAAGGAPASPTTSSSAPVVSGAAASGPVDREQAGRIATDRFGGRVLNVETDTANGAPTWEVEIADSREGRIEVDVAQATGQIVEMERDG